MNWITRLSDLIKAEPTNNDILLVKLVTVTCEHRDDKWQYKAEKPRICPAHLTFDNDRLAWIIFDNNYDTLTIKYELFDKARMTNTLGYDTYVGDETKGHEYIVYHIISACAVEHIETKYEPDFRINGLDADGTPIKICETDTIDEARAVLKCLDDINIRETLRTDRYLHDTAGKPIKALVITDTHTKTLRIIHEQNESR